ncbi:hypothetical protein RFA60_000204 [Vibrio parahaemolyticus]|nr:hypothetical protein [Vibrio parahaemolyticus]
MLNDKNEKCKKSTLQKNPIYLMQIILYFNLDMGLIEEKPNNLVQEQENKSKNRRKIKP